ncbi:sugar phosphate nucleotidyltransferase [Candidatus Pelagibacter sp.]|nr:sugar phosphate nucleotidyltransferase [Candidatus Pelagibacter sp.]
MYKKQNKNFKEYVISSNLNIKEAIIKLNETGLKIVCIVDKKQKLLGTLSDGDIRRALLKNLNLNDSIQKIMNKSPKYVNLNTKEETINKFYKNFKIKDIPLLDNNGKLLDIISKNSEKLDNLIYIIAGGRGKRMMPLTKYNPKPMLEYMGVPILERILLKIKSEGFNNVTISINYLGKKIEKYFQKGENLGLKINYLKEKKEMGTAGSLHKLMNYENNLPIIVTNADLFTNLKLKDLLHYHNENKSDFTVATKEHHYQNPFGVIVNKGKKVLKISEKPTYNFNINAGVYCINKDLLKFIKNNTYLDMPNLINKLIKNKKKIFIFPLHEDWKDLQKPSDLS